MINPINSKKMANKKQPHPYIVDVVMKESGSTLFAFKTLKQAHSFFNYVNKSYGKNSHFISCCIRSERLISKI